VTGRAWHLLEVFRDMPGVRLFPSAGYQHELDALLRILDEHHYAVNVHETLVNERNVQAVHDSGALICTWPINAWRSANRVLDLGVDGLISDSMQLLREVV